MLLVSFFGFQEMRFRTESAKSYHPKHTPEGSSFWPHGGSKSNDCRKVGKLNVLKRQKVGKNFFSAHVRGIHHGILHIIRLSF